MFKKTLLLNSSYEVLAFINYRKTIKLILKDKVEIISTWDDSVSYCSGEFELPSVLRLKQQVRRHFITPAFSRRTVVKRDNSSCQYCSKKLTPSQVTIDHVVPKAKGGVTTFSNCVVSCHACNNKKADKTLEETGMILLKKPTHPAFCSVTYLLEPKDYWCDIWDQFLVG